MTAYLIIPFAFLVLAFMIRMPIGWGMVVGCIVYFIAKGLSLGTLLNSMCYGVFNAYVLIAIPLFVFTANVMNYANVTDRIFKFANAIVGRGKGGTAKVNILASLIFAGMTGSALADASGLGKIEIDQMDQEGYDKPFSCAITAATSVIGPIFPPSIPMVVYAMVSGASVGKLFMGGIVPAIMMALLLGVYVTWISNKRNYPRGDSRNFKQFIGDTLNAIPALMIPVILLIGIYTGVMTPTEAGAVAALYALLIAVFIYRTMKITMLKNILMDTIRSIGNIFLIVMGAYGFSYIINIEQLGAAIGNFVTNLGMGQVGFLLVINLLFIVLGMLVDVNISQLVVLPLIIPAVKVLGIDLTHFGVMICLNMMIGLLTPPFGMLLFIVSGVGKCPIKDIIKEVMPMILIEFVVLFLITFFPQLVLFVVR